MKFLFFLRRRPWWIREFTRGGLRVHVGKERKGGCSEIIVRFQTRVKFGQWKTIGTFRYLDVPVLKELQQEVDEFFAELMKD